jgi:hypothetical protein
MTASFVERQTDGKDCDIARLGVDGEGALMQADDYLPQQPFPEGQIGQSLGNLLRMGYPGVAGGFLAWAASR